MVSQELPELWGQRPEEVNSLRWSSNAQQCGYYDLTDCSAHNGFRGQLLAFYPLRSRGQALTVSKHTGIRKPGKPGPATGNHEWLQSGGGGPARSGQLLPPIGSSTRIQSWQL